LPQGLFHFFQRIAHIIPDIKKVKKKNIKIMKKRSPPFIFSHAIDFFDVSERKDSASFPFAKFFKISKVHKT